MTEAEWLACDDPTEMAFNLRRSGKGSDRKLRLFAVACCRRIWHLVPDNPSRQAVEVAERFADGFATEEQRQAALRGAEAARMAVNAPGSFRVYLAATLAAVAYTTVAVPWDLEVIGLNASREASTAAAYCGLPDADDADDTAAYEATRVAWANEQATQAKMLRDIFGNPFRPVALSQAEQTPTAVALAQAIYDERAFDRLPILADALEDAGCTDAAILGHCRGPGPHVRGCWVVDLILGKS
jgi:hypothetical protein